MMNRLTVILATLVAFAGPVKAQAPHDGTEGQDVLFPIEAGEEYGPAGGLWVTGDYLVGWIDRAEYRPLVTTGLAATSPTLAGIPGTAGTRTLFGGNLNDEARSGFRIGVGYQFAEDSPVGIEAGAMVMESQETSFSVSSSDDLPILARPFIDARTGNLAAVRIAFPGESTGSVQALADSGKFYEAHINLTEKICDGSWGSLESLLGYRFCRHEEALHLRHTIVPTDPLAIPGSQSVNRDDIAVQNEFHGLDMGMRGRLKWDSISLELLGKVAAGNLRREVSIQGRQITTVPGTAPQVDRAGLLALSTNSGIRAFNDWRALPEFGTVLNWQVTSSMQVRLGYSMLCLSSAARPENQIDFMLNPNLFPPAQPGTPNPARPRVKPDVEDIWIQNISLGVELNF